MHVQCQQRATPTYLTASFKRTLEQSGYQMREHRYNVDDGRLKADNYGESGD